MALTVNLEYRHPGSWVFERGYIPTLASERMVRSGHHTRGLPNLGKGYLH
jgi:hypothetical protein